MHYPNHGCKIVMESQYGKSHCETCGREWEALTPKGAAEHCARELGTRVALMQETIEMISAISDDTINGATQNDLALFLKAFRKMANYSLTGSNGVING